MELSCTDKVERTINVYKIHFLCLCVCDPNTLQMGLGLCTLLNITNMQHDYLLPQTTVNYASGITYTENRLVILFLHNLFYSLAAFEGNI